MAGKKVANSLGMNLKLYTGSGTPFPSVGYTRKSKKKIDEASLYDFKILERELIRQIKTNDVILLAIRFPVYFGGTYYGNSQDLQFFREDGSLISEKNYFVQRIKSVTNFANIVIKRERSSFKSNSRMGIEKRVMYETNGLIYPKRDCKIAIFCR